MRGREMFDARQEVQKIEDSLPGFIFRVPGVVLKTKGSDQVVFKLMMSKGGEGEEEEMDLLKLMMSSAEKKKEEEQKLIKKTNKMRIRRDQIRVGLLRALRYSK